MKVSKTVIGGGVEILAADDFKAVPLAITGADVVKAGMPITPAGAPIAAGTGAIGILLYDVDPTANPNAAVVVEGIIDWGKCKANSGATATATDIAQILPAIQFREDGKTYTANSNLAVSAGMEVE